MAPIEFTCDVQEGFNKETGILNTILPDGSLLGSIELRKKGEAKAEIKDFNIEVREGSEEGKLVTKALRFRARTENQATQNVDSKDGIVNLKIGEGKTYQLAMMDDADYSFKNVFVFYKDGSGKEQKERLMTNQDHEIEFNLSGGTDYKLVIVLRNDQDNPVQPGKCPSDICRFSDDKVRVNAVPLKYTTNGETTVNVTEDVNFVLFNASR